MPVNDPDKFKKQIAVDPDTKCWNWNHSVFRWRVDHVVHSPRRYAAMMMGYVIPAGRNLMSVCGNDKCCNPEHTRLKHDGSKLSREAPRYFLDLSHFHYPPGWLARQYCVDKPEVKKMRDRTLELIYRVRTSRAPADRICNEYDISPSFVRLLKDLTESEFRGYDNDPHEGMYEIDDFYNPAGEKFKPKHMM